MMIKNILTILRNLEDYGISEEIDIASGKYEIPRGFKDIVEKIKRTKIYKK